MSLLLLVKGVYFRLRRLRTVRNICYSQLCQQIFWQSDSMQKNIPGWLAEVNQKAAKIEVY